MGKKPSVDVKEQAALGAEVPPQRDITREVFELIKQSADALLERGVKRGAILVIGRFASMGAVRGARQLSFPGGKPNPFEGQYVSAGDKAFQRMLLQDAALEDGAVIVDASGQVLAGRILLVVDHPEVEIPEGCATRHVAAASTSLRRDVEAVITLSEEKNVARVFRDGKVAETYDPAAPKEKPARKKRKTTGKKAVQKRKAAKRRTTAKMAKEPVEKPFEKPVKKPGEKPVEKPVEKPADQTAERPEKDSVDTPQDRGEEASR